MEKVASFNVYVKGGKMFAVVKTADGKAYSLNGGLMQYAIKNVKYLDKKEGTNND